VSINPPSDIVLDVARASDPQKYRAAVERLMQLGGTGKAKDTSTVRNASSGAAETFSLPSPARTAPVTSENETAPPTTASALSTATAAQNTTSNDKRAAAYQKFEAFLLQTFVEAMLPKDATNVYGSGTAGDIWRSMFAEHIANELSESAKLGIAERISENRNRS
jgi:hypothetical protein